MESVSVIIPTWQEEARIGARLAELQTSSSFHEVIVVDGESTDRTVDVARGFAGVRVAGAARGRALQMNAGARMASGNVLLFLHADVRLPEDAARRIRETLDDPAVVAGAFRTWTIAEGRRSILVPFLHLADLRSRYSRLPYGDQALFVRAEAFTRVGGFPEQLLMEDLEIARRLRRLGRIRTVRASVHVSGRRFLARPLASAVLMNVLPFLCWLGVPPSLLAGYYGDPR